jgi:hypothetical protein
MHQVCFPQGRGERLPIMKLRMRNSRRVPPESPFGSANPSKILKMQHGIRYCFCLPCWRHLPRLCGRNSPPHPTPRR